MKAILRDSDTNIIGLEAEVATAIREKLAVRPKGAKRDSYSETSVDSYWEALFFHMNSLNRFQSRWAWLNHLYQEQIGRVLTKIDPAIRQVVNFGVFCGNPDYGLALRFPDVTFVGVDREIRTKKLNDLAYRAPNLHFIAADILEVVADLANKSRPSLLYHARTATMCYPEYLRTLYRTCAAASVDYIALWESQAISRSTLRFQDFDAMSEDAIPFGGQTLIHNYKKLLEEAGYEIVVLENWPLSCDLLVDQDILGDGYVFMVARRAAA